MARFHFGSQSREGFNNSISYSHLLRWCWVSENINKKQLRSVWFGIGYLKPQACCCKFKIKQVYSTTLG